MSCKDYFSFTDLILFSLLLTCLGCQSEEITLTQTEQSVSQVAQREITVPRTFNPDDDARPLQTGLSEAILDSGIFDEYPVPTQHEMPIAGGTSPVAPQYIQTLPRLVSPRPQLQNPPQVTRLPQVETVSPQNLVPNQAAINAQLPPNTAYSKPLSNHALGSVRGRAKSLTEHGISLAQRGAYYSARAEFIQALRLLTQTVDTQLQTHRYSQALADGLLAMEEAGDFIPQGSQLEANVDLRRLVESHKTPVLKKAQLSELTTLTAMKYYYEYAQNQLSIAGHNIPEASQALFGLAKIQPYLSIGNDSQNPMNGPRAVALYQAAVSIDPANAMAGNELAVLLARYGQFAEAKQILMEAVQSSPRKEIWDNLAKVHEYLGEAQLAQLARNESNRTHSSNQSEGQKSVVRWTSPQVFANQGRPDLNHQRITQSPNNPSGRVVR